MKRIQVVSLEFNETQTPYSPIFNDVYYSKKTGIDESIYVYLQGSGFNQALEEKTDQETFTVGEIGFGVGLNFLLTYRHFLENSKPHQKLTYISAEKFPVAIEGLRKLYPQYSELKLQAESLLAQYPVLTPGIHVLTFERGRIRLLLLLGEAREMFSNLQLPPDQRVQHWYWDGFAPDRNPDAFDAELFKSLKRISAPGARAASFTSAGWVRRGIAEAGHTVHKRKGFGTKRESVVAEVAHEEPNEKPWFSSRKLKTLRAGDHVAVVGGGLSGTAIARSLAERGFAVTILEQEKIAAHASGNVCGLFNVQLSKKPNPISRFSQLSLTHFLREIEFLKIPTRKGILRLDAVREREVFDEAMSSSEYPESFFESREDGMIFGECGILNPSKLCERRAQHPNIEFRKVKVSQIEKTANVFEILDENGKSTGTFQHVVYATGSSQVRDQFLPHPLLRALPLRPIRGQVIYLKPTSESGTIAHALVDSGYITPLAPEISGMNAHIVGATYQAKTIQTNQEQLDSNSLLEEARGRHPAFSPSAEKDILGIRVGYRLSTPDKLPMIGPLCDPEKLKAQFFPALRSGKPERASALEAEDGEWIFLGMGSRGVTFSSYGAEVLASLMCGEALPIESDLWEHLHSARFIVRNLKKPEAPDGKLR